MSDFLAEASVLIRPDTTSFRADLIAQIAAATRSIPPIPVSIVADPRATAGLVAAQKEAQSAALGLASTEQVLNSALARQAVVLDADTVAANTNAVAVERAGVAAASSAAQARAHAQQLGQVNKALIANAASLAGLRGATLAASTPFIAATVGVVAFAKAVKTAADTEQNLNQFRAVTQATGEEMEAASEAARNLGRDIALPGVSAADAAQAFTELSKAGLDVQQSIDAARGTLLLATAAGIDNAQAVELTANALNSFGLAGNQAARVADLLAGASIAAQGSIVDMGIALRQAEAVARQVGLTVEDTVTFITLLAKNGLSASDAGTSLRVALVRLIAPSKDAQAVIRQLGLQIRDLQGNLRPDIFDQFARATESFTAAQRDAAAVTIFGQDSIRTLAILAREGAQGFEDVRAQVVQAGNAQRVASARTQGFSGQVNALNSNLETLGGTLGGLILPTLTSVTGGLNLLIGSLNRSIDFIGRFTNQTKQAPQTIDQVTARISELRRQIADLERSGGRDLTGGLRERLERLEQQLRDLIDEGMAPALVATDNFGKGLADAASRARDFTIATGLMSSELSNFADAASRVSIPTFIPPDLVTTTAATQTKLRNEIEKRNQAILQAQISGDKRLERQLLVEQERTIRELIAIQEGIIARGDVTGAATAQKRRGELLQQLAGVAASIRGIDAGTEAAAKRAAAEAKARASRIARARLDAQQAIIDAVGARVTARENAVLRASLREGLQDDLRANILLRNSILAGIDNVRAIVARTAAEAKQKAAAIASLSRELINVLKTIADLRKEIADKRRQDAEEARQRALDIIGARIELAEATGNRAAEIAARKARIKALQDEIRAAHGDTLKILQLRTEIANERKALKELQGEVAQRNQAFKELSFEFLQAQQGFAANLLGNLIPGFATGGLVGGGGPAPAAAEGAFRVPAEAVKPPQTGIGIEAGLAAARGGVTQGQFSALLDLTRQIVRLLGGNAAARGAPEAWNQRQLEMAAMDSIPSGGGV